MTPTVRGPARILVIDDSDLARDTMADLLSREGYVVFQLASPIGATREIVRREIDLVVVDLNMPTLRGDSLAKLFRANAHPRFQRLGLVLITGEASEAVEQIATAVNADGFVTKADAKARLGALVRRVLAARSAAG